MPITATSEKVHEIYAPHLALITQALERRANLNLSTKVKSTARTK